jgi:hypothetical protein
MSILCAIERGWLKQVEKWDMLKLLTANDQDLDFRYQVSKKRVMITKQNNAIRRKGTQFQPCLPVLFFVQEMDM